MSLPRPCLQLTEAARWAVAAGCHNQHKGDHEVPLVTDGTSLTDQHVVMEYFSVLGKKLQDQFHLKNIVLNLNFEA